MSFPCPWPFRKETGPCPSPRRLAARELRRADSREATESSCLLGSSCDRPRNRSTSPNLVKRQCSSHRLQLRRAALDQDAIPKLCLTPQGAGTARPLQDFPVASSNANELSR